MKIFTACTSFLLLTSVSAFTPAPTQRQTTDLSYMGGRYGMDSYEAGRNGGRGNPYGDPVS